MEDNPGDARLIRERIVDLDRIRPELVHVETLVAALERLGAAPPDLVLLDLNLPDSRDIGTVRTVVEAAPMVPIIVLTGRKAGEAATRALRLGAQDYLVKDEITGPLLERSIRYAVQRKAAGEEVRWHERRFRLLAEHIEDVFYLLEMHGDEPEAVVRHRHELGPVSFLEQHYRYGRGTSRLRETGAEDGPGLEPPSFYVDLLWWPLRRGTTPGAVGRAAILALSQLANAAGYLRSALADRLGGD